nr:hypothetical protein [Tanacetum cinerariifolium]
MAEHVILMPDPERRAGDWMMNDGGSMHGGQFGKGPTGNVVSLSDKGGRSTGV